jgi:hypothetical protein
MHTNNILIPEQFDVRQGSSTENAAFKLTDSVFNSINRKMHVAVIFCDVAKAFDYVSHEIFLAKLHYYGIQGTVADWSRSYWADRKQRTEMKPLQKFFSKWGTTKHVVHAGSILGPLLFIIYISDLLPTMNTS